MNAIKIAELAGVSKSTVYRALNGEKIKESTKRRIMRVIKENNMADSFAGFGSPAQNVRLVALVSGAAEKKYLSSVIDNIKNKFVSNGFTVIDVAAETAAAETEKLVSKVKFHGYIFIGEDVCRSCSQLIRLASESRPVIQIHSESDLKNVYSVSTESEKAMTAAAAKLSAKRGHRNVLCCIPESMADSAYGRKLAGTFELALRSNGAFGCKMLTCYPTPDSSEVIADTIRRDPDITAIAAFDEYTAASAVKAAQMLGLRIPEDISVIGFQNCDELTPFIQNISCVNTKSDAVADMALMLMVAAANGRSVAHSIKIPCTYSERRSTAPAPQRTAFISAVIGSFASA